MGEMDDIPFDCWEDFGDDTAEEVRCKFCGTRDLLWGDKDGKPRLWDPEKRTWHTCPTKAATAGEFGPVPQ